MKPLPIPQIPGNTPSERLSNALSMTLKVSKEELQKREAQLKREKQKKRAKERKKPS